MSTSFRQKLLNLLCSALLVCLVTASCAAVGWYTDLLLYETGDDSLDLSQMVGALGETLTIYCVLMSFVLFWHLWDLIGPSTRRARAITHLFGYSAFALILAALFSCAQAGLLEIHVKNRAALSTMSATYRCHRGS